jgi:hypothetical protein
LTLPRWIERKTVGKEQGLPSIDQLQQPLAEIKAAAACLASYCGGAATTELRLLPSLYHVALQEILLSLALCFVERGQRKEAVELTNCCTALRSEPGLALPLIKRPAEMLEPFKPLSELIAIYQPQSEQFFTNAIEQALYCRQETDRLGMVLYDLYHSRSQAIDGDALVADRIKRGDEAFIISRQAYNLWGLLEGASHHQTSHQIKNLLQDATKRLVRYNRESPLFLKNEAVAVTPIEHHRNFKRDNTEHMYFLTLHSLPTAFDLFCCTFTDTPRHYRQELHMHRYSAELTLILDGQSDCIWYAQEALDNQASYHEIGRVTAGPLQAFRIPTQVLHTLYNPESDNKNLTIKLSTFIDDRLGQNDWELALEKKREDPVAIDCGESRNEPWGKTVLYSHGYQNVNFTYKIDLLEPGAVMPINAWQERCFFLYDGEIEIQSRNRKPLMQTNGGNIIRIAPGVEAEITNISMGKAILFSVEGLPKESLLDKPAQFSAYPSWFMKDFLWSVL